MKAKKISSVIRREGVGALQPLYIVARERLCLPWNYCNYLGASWALPDPVADISTSQRHNSPAQLGFSSRGRPSPWQYSIWLAHDRSRMCHGCATAGRTRPWTSQKRLIASSLSVVKFWTSQQPEISRSPPPPFPPQGPDAVSQGHSSGFAPPLCPATTTLSP